MADSDSVPGLDLVLLLSQASHTLTIELTARLEAFGISVREYCVLSKALPGSFTQTQLADMSDLDKTTMVVTVDELERAGLAERQPSPVDRRARIVVVTPAGGKAVAQARKIVTQVYDDVLATLPARERKGFVDALVRLVEGLRSSSVSAAVDEKLPVRRQRSVKSVRSG
jgi:MarR family transcriptional regulator for hemolysin